jgi:hypothetical protein
LQRGNITYKGLKPTALNETGAWITAEGIKIAKWAKIFG